MALDYDKTMRRIGKAKTNKSLWESHLQECYRYFMPERDTFDYYSPGSRKNEHVFNSVPIEALADFATRMESELVPPGREWLKLSAGTDIPEDQKFDIEQYLEEATRILFEHINHSNFSSQIHECFMDLGISTGALIVEEGDGIQSALRFRAVPLSELILERSSRGTIDTVWREITVQAADIPELWPYAELTERMAKDVEDDPSNDYSLIEGVMYNEDKDTYTAMLLFPDENAVLYEEEIDSSPWVVFRETTIPGETYGRGRAMIALSDAKTLNKVVENYLRGSALISQPIYTAMDDGIINPATIRLEPNSIIPVSSNSTSDPTLRPLPPAGAPEISKDLINTYEERIRQIMLSKPFGRIDETPVRTATEMAIRNADLAKTSLGASGRIQMELLNRLVDRCVYILKRAGKIADFKVDGREVKIKYTSPSARSQDESDLATVMRYMEIIANLPPEIIDMTVKIEDVPEYIADIMGISKTILRSELERMQKQQQQQDAQKRALALAATQNGGQPQQ